MEKTHLLEVKHLRTFFFTQDGEVKAVNDVSYHVDEQEVVAIVGESGCGKSVTQLSVMQLVQSPPGRIVGGEILFRGRNLLTLSRKEMQAVRGAQISMIFQEPMTSLNPVFTIGQQITDVICHHMHVSRKKAWEIGTAALDSVGIPDPSTRMRNYPFEMSGGMRQRVLIAIGVACQSRLIIADEPTTALDVTTQAQVMELLLSLVHKNQTSVVVVTHNLGLVTRYADRVYVMYAGKVVESGTTEQLLTEPRHPYTLGLLNSVPALGSQKKEELTPIKGNPPSLAALPQGCSFHPRCPYAQDECRQSCPELKPAGEKGHMAACHFTLEKEA